MVMETPCDLHIPHTPTPHPNTCVLQGHLPGPSPLTRGPLQPSSSPKAPGAFSCHRTCSELLTLCSEPPQRPRPPLPGPSERRSALRGSAPWPHSPLPQACPPEVLSHPLTKAVPSPKDRQVASRHWQPPGGATRWLRSWSWAWGLGTEGTVGWWVPGSLTAPAAAGSCEPTLRVQTRRRDKRTAPPPALAPPMRGPSPRGFSKSSLNLSLLPLWYVTLGKLPDPSRPWAPHP